MEMEIMWWRKAKKNKRTIRPIPTAIMGGASETAGMTSRLILEIESHYPDTSDATNEQKALALLSLAAAYIAQISDNGIRRTIIRETPVVVPQLVEWNINKMKEIPITQPVQSN